MRSAAAGNMNNKLGRSVACILSLCLPVAGLAHHSAAAYDLSREAVVEGVLTEVFWRNPHVYLTVETMAPDGEVVLQQIEAFAPSSLSIYGVRPEDLRTGERVSVRVHPNRRGPGRDVLGLALTQANGTVLALRGGVIAPPSTLAQASGLAGIWTPDAPPFIALSRAVESWPFTEAGRLAATDTATRLSVGADCIPFGPPTVMMSPTVKTIEVADDRVIIDDAAADMRRVVHMRAAPPPGTGQTNATGYSLGRWEGETLVVETTAFAPDPEGLGFALPSSADKQVLERFTLAEDRRSLHYEATLTDAQFLAEPVSMSTIWFYRPEIELQDLTCDPETARRFQATETGE